MVWIDFDQLYKKQFPVVYRYLTGLCENLALADELAQESFYRGIEHSASFKENAGCPYCCAKSEKNCWLSYLRKAKRQAGDEALKK